MSGMAYEITSLTILYPTVYSGADKKTKKLQSSASLAFVRGIHWWPVNSPHKGPVTRKMFPFDDVIMISEICICPLKHRTRTSSSPCLKMSQHLTMLRLPPFRHSADCKVRHEDVIKWKHFPRYWPFVRGIHRSPVIPPHKGRGALMFSLICALNERLSKQSWGWWIETPSHPLWRHCNSESLLGVPVLTSLATDAYIHSKFILST